jgi:hypothetical protein
MIPSSDPTNGDTSPSPGPQRQPVFVAPRNRDAWSTIRGFVYQADLTIERWLHLEPEKDLQLECGEDIDTVSQYIQDGAEERLLEQVKHREENVTLKHASVLAALANAVEHRQNNPEKRLLFRFTTNAHAGKERLSPFPGNSPGISAWERLRLAELGSQPLAESIDVAEREAKRLLDGIRQILTGAQTRPEGLNEGTWKRFRKSIESAEDPPLLALIRSFEWSVGAPAAEDMSDRIQQILLEYGHATDAITAYGQYQRLFLHVLKTLSKPTEKRLSLSDLPVFLRQPLSESDREFFQNFLRQMGLRDHKLTFLQAQMGRQERRLVDIGEQVSRMLESSRVQALTLSTPLPIFEPPPIGEKLSPRTETVDQLKHELDRMTWLALTGSSGTGKSYLALLVAARYACCPVWLRFRDLDVGQAAAMLDAVFLHLRGGVVSSRHHELYAAACRQFGPNALIVLDDVPALLGGDPLVQRLELLVRACSETGVKLLTTSVHRLPGVLQRVARGHLTQSDAPPLTDLEALEILQSFSAPPKLLANFASVRFLNAVAQHHPALFTAIALFLEAHGWQWRDQQFEALLLGRFAQGVNDETIRRLLATVTDGPSRNLLYRLNLVIGTFDMETVRVLAAVEPSVHEPRERLTALADLWVQRDTREQMRVSPLIHALGSDDLTDEVKRGCHSALAEQLLQKGTLAPYELEMGVTHLLAAQEHERAVLLLTWGLSQLQQALETGQMDISRAKKLGLYSIFWGVPLPQSVSLQTRLLLRSQQLHIAEVLSGDMSFVLADLSRLIDEAGEAEAMGLFAAAISAAPILARIDFDASCHCLTKAVHALPQITLPEGSLMELLPGLTPGSLLWINLFGVRTKAHVHCWCDMLSNVPVEVRQQALSDQLADMGASVLVDRLWLAEADRSTAERNWERVIADIDEIAVKCEAMAAELLVATAVRAKILVLCEHLHQPDRAIALAEAALTHLSDDLRVRFMICDAIGQQLSYVDDKETEAAVWLQRADSVCELIPQRLQWERAMTLLALARLADKRGEADTTTALLARAVELVRSLPHRSETEMAKLLGELAVAQWKQDNYRGAFEALDDAVPRLLKARTEVAEWKALFTIFGHTAGYMANCARTGHPPTLADGAPFVLPPVGNFHNMKEAGLASVYRPERDIALPCIMAQFAQAVERDDRVAYWADQAIAMGRQSPAAGSVVATTTFSILPHLVVSGRLAEFFDSAR